MVRGFVLFAFFPFTQVCSQVRNFRLPFSFFLFPFTQVRSQVRNTVNRVKARLPKRAPQAAALPAPEPAAPQPQPTPKKERWGLF